MDSGQWDNQIIYDFICSLLKYSKRLWVITIFSSFSLVLAKSNNWNILLNNYETDRAVYSKPNITETVNLTVKYFMVKKKNNIAMIQITLQWFK